MNKHFKPNISHPSYIARKGILKAIKKHRGYICGRVMDFGCGTKPYKELFDYFEYVGVDFKGEGHCHKNEQIDIFYSGNVLPIKTESFDSIISTEVFEHVINLEEMMKELHRVLKTGGKILVTVPLTYCEHEMPVDYRRFTSVGLKELFERHGFEIVLSEKIGSASDTMAQVFISYFYEAVIRKYLGKIPVVRTIASVLIISLLNVLAIVVNAILPKCESLYLDNILIATKK